MTQIKEQNIALLRASCNTWVPLVCQLRGNDVSWRVNAEIHGLLFYLNLNLRSHFILS
jgi:hypothetical protein